MNQSKLNSKEIKNIIAQGESATVEFKQSFNRQVIETLTAFANTRGGNIIIGIADNGKVIGIEIGEESIQTWINEIKGKTNPQLIPDVDIVAVDKRKLVIMTIQEYPVKPVAVQGKYFKRVSNSNHLMNPNEIANEHLKTINSSWDYYPDPYHNIDHISINKIQKFIERIEQYTHNKIDSEPLDFLSKLEIIRNKQLSFGGYLLFVKDHCPISDVQVGRFKSPVTIIDSISVSSDLFTEIDEIIFFIRKHLMVEYIITGEPQHTERFDYPIEAIREIVINMVVHRDYRDSGHSVIKIFDDKIEFYNPGRLYGNLTVKDLLTGDYTSQIRNKLLAKAFKEIGYIERYGSGIKRIINICKSYGILEPVFEEKPNGFMVTIFKQKNRKAYTGEKDQNKVTDKVTDRVTDKVTDNQKKIILAINSNNRITTAQLSDLVGISQRKIKENISKLKEDGIITREGPPKGGFWKIIHG